MVDILHFASLVEGFLRCRPHTDEIDCSHVVDVVLSRLHLKNEKVPKKNSTPLQIASKQRDWFKFRLILIGFNWLKQIDFD